MHQHKSNNSVIRQMLNEIKGEIDINTIVQNLTSTNIMREKSVRNHRLWYDILGPMDLINIYRAFHLKAVGCIFFGVHMEHFPG